MRGLIVALFIIILLSSAKQNGNQSSRCRLRCKAQYLKEKGPPISYSEKYDVEVSFLWGKELNESTQSEDYESNAQYAVIFWQQNQATVIKLHTFISSRPFPVSMSDCPDKLLCSCLPSVAIIHVTGSDQRDVFWIISSTVGLD